MVDGDSSFRCYYDGLPCERYVDDLGFGVCYVKGLDGKLRSVCPRFKVSSSVSVVGDLVPKELLPE